jgi:hypothetical protein
VEKRGKKFHSPEKKGNGFFTKATILASRHRIKLNPKIKKKSKKNRVFSYF